MRIDKDPEKLKGEKGKRFTEIELKAHKLKEKLNISAEESDAIKDRVYQKLGSKW